MVPEALSGPSEMPKGSLAGIPIVISPDIDMAGAATHCGCDALRAAVSSTDSATLAALRAAGVHVLGQTTSAELNLSVAYATSGIAKNPYSNFGISGGSVAAAVASRVATLGMCLDVVGGSRVAAALCGVAAFRPTHGRYDSSGTFSLSSTLASLTIVARTVRDLQLTDAVITSQQLRVFEAKKKLDKQPISSSEPKNEEETLEVKAATLIQAVGRGSRSRNKLRFRVGGVNSTPKSVRDSQAVEHGTEGLDRLVAMNLAVEGDSFTGVDGPGSPGSPTPKLYPKSGSTQFVADLAGLRIGVPRSSEFFANLSPAVAAVIDAALSRLSKAGAILVDVDIVFAGSLGERHTLAQSAAAIAEVLLAYEAPREVAAYVMSRKVPALVAPKPEGEEEVEEEDGEPKALPATVFVPLDSIVTAAKIINGFKGPAPQKALLAAQLTVDAVSSMDYRAALVHQRPALKRAFEDMFENDCIDALVYPATIIPAISPRGTEGASVDFADGVAVSYDLVKRGWREKKDKWREKTGQNLPNPTPPPPSGPHYGLYTEHSCGHGRGTAGRRCTLRSYQAQGRRPCRRA